VRRDTRATSYRCAWGSTVMSLDSHEVLASELPECEAGASPEANRLIETALTVTFAAAAVLFISFLVVATGLV